MSNEQKLREAFDTAFELMFEAYATPADRFQNYEAWAIWQHGKVTRAFTLMQQARQALATTEPAVNQQLTTEPFDERAARATLPTQRSSMDGLPKPFGYVSDGFADGLRFQHNPWPVEHTLLHSTLPVFSAAAVQQFKEDAERYRWLRDDTDSDWAICEWSHDPGDEGYYRDARAPHIVDAAIDAAMAQGVK